MRRSPRSRKRAPHDPPPRRPPPLRSSLAGTRCDAQSGGPLMTTIDDKVIVVTGAASGIGRALAYDLARRGATLAISDVDEVRLAETARHVRTIGARVH